MKQCLIDSSSAILLYKCGLISQLVGVYKTVMTASVFEELTVDGYPGAREFADYAAINLVRIQTLAAGRVPHWTVDDGLLALDEGERDTILCYEGTLPDSFIIIDDGKAAQYCRIHKIPYINALLFPRIAYLAGMLLENDFHKKYAQLSSIGRYSEEIKAFALQCSRTEIAFFLP